MNLGSHLPTLTVQVPASFGRILIAQSLPRFMLTHAGLRLQMRATSSIEQLPPLDADAAVRIGPIADSGLIAREVGVVRFVTCASPEFVELHGAPDSPSDLAPTCCIALLDSCANRVQEWRFRRGRAAYRLSPAAHMAFSDSECAVAAATRGGGYVRVLSIEADLQVAAGLLRPVLEEWNDECLPVVIVRSRDGVAPDGMAAFEAFVAALLPAKDD